LLATLTLDLADEQTWGERGTDGRAGYLHTIVVAPDHIGAGLGRALVRWAEQSIREMGRQLSRLDCSEANEQLRLWYRQQGYEEVGRKDYGDRWFPVTLLERDLGASPDGR
jgi:ribosomal protein S18 acetylase RimI-like enzyme